MNAIILINFGGPRNVEEIRPFLEDIFRDVLPHPLKFIAPLLARLREPYAKKIYSAIGGASPVVSWTVKQGAELEKKLNTKVGEPLCGLPNREGTGEVDALPHPNHPLTKGMEFRVYAGMKYGRPSISDAIEEANADGCKKIILLPLFPYQSRYTQIPSKLNTQTLKHLNTSPLYISAMADIIKSALLKMGSPPAPQTDLIFSVHAIPLKTAKEEPYIRQVNESVAEIMKQFTGYNYHIAFQSAYGPIKWTKPCVKQILTQTLKHSNTQTLLIPLGFACENIETLYEIDQIYIPYAKSLGFKNIARTQALNDHPQFIDLLKELVLMEGGRGDPPLL